MSTARTVTHAWTDLPVGDRGRVLVLYCGGTIGMKNKGNGFEPVPGFIHETLAKTSCFHDSDFGTPVVADILNFTFVTPVLKAGKRAVYQVREYTPLLDSSNIGTADWARMAQDIEASYADWDAFVIIHGTDTMSYTASALSFMLENLGKTVVVTGSQIPLAIPLNDGQSNLLGALSVAAHYETPEVLLYFSGKAMRGNRTTKGDASGLDGFISANFRPLIELGVDYIVDWQRMQPPPVAPFRACTNYDTHVAVFRLFPGFEVVALENALRPPLRGLVLQTFGSGNAPDSAVAVLTAAAERGVVIVNVTQCQKGMVEAHYAVGVALRRAGVTPGYDMTVEAALTKLGHLLAKPNLTPDDVRVMIEKDLRGELTATHDQRFSFKDTAFIASVYSALHHGATVSSTDLRAAGEMALIGAALKPVLMCSAAGKGDLPLMTKMAGDGADVNATDYDLRSPLHVAAAEGHIDMCLLLVERGANVNVRDRFGNTPLAEAVRGAHDSVARVLQAAGACLHISDVVCATLLNAAACGDAVAVARWLSFGVHPDTADYDRRTAAHVAACDGHADVLLVLQSQGAHFNLKDRWNRTATDEMALHHPQLLASLALHTLPEA